MDFFFQIIDVDYEMVGDKPIVRIFGKCEDSKTACLFVDDFLPYFYVMPMESGKDVTKFLQDRFGKEIISIDEVERFLPHCYKKDKAKMLKITCKDPSKVRDMRDEIWKEGIAKKIFEADILFKYRFMADRDLHGTRWYKVTGTPVNTITVRAERKFNLVSITPAEERPFAFRTMSIDIEIATLEGLPDANHDPIIMISLAFEPKFQRTFENGRIFVAGV